MQFHKLDKARDNGFWSVRVSGDIGLIVHRMPGNLRVAAAPFYEGVSTAGPALARAGATIGP